MDFPSTVGGPQVVGGESSPLRIDICGKGIFLAEEISCWRGNYHRAGRLLWAVKAHRYGSTFVGREYSSLRRSVAGEGVITTQVTWNPPPQVVGGEGSPLRIDVCGEGIFLAEEIGCWRGNYHRAGYLCVGGDPSPRSLKIRTQGILPLRLWVVKTHRYGSTFVGREYSSLGRSVAGEGVITAQVTWNPPPQVVGGDW
ncbi:hypothetical protein AAF712_002814 [Marasmius tenuissimus]|uniref:Uncharacterized protein n=1 Tax=Marasmius tenuissimus TaxID=585030 RepID=A0ABR3A994_9AGAR